MVGKLRAVWPNTLVLNTGFGAGDDRDELERVIADGVADAVTVGRPFIGNPDLVTRWARAGELTEPDQETLYGGAAGVGMTVDGMIAGPDGEIDFFPLGQDLIDWFVAEYPEVIPGHLREPLGVTADARHFDTVVQGRATYEPALAAGITSPYPHLREYVVSTSIGASPDPAVTVIDDDPLAAVRALKAQDGGGIYLAGGGRLAGALLPEIDELVIKVYPTVAGAGIPLFTADFAPTQLTLVSATPFESGAVVLHYRR